VDTSTTVRRGASAEGARRALILPCGAGGDVCYRRQPMARANNGDAIRRAGAGYVREHSCRLRRECDLL